MKINSPFLVVFTVSTALVIATDWFSRAFIKEPILCHLYQILLILCLSLAARFVMSHFYKSIEIMIFGVLIGGICGGGSLLIVSFMLNPVATFRGIELFGFFDTIVVFSGFSLFGGSWMIGGVSYMMTKIIFARWA